MNYSKALFLMSGEVITITEDEEKQVQQSLVAGAEWVSVQGNLINAKSISKIGNHHATSQIRSLEKSQAETEMKILGRYDLVDAKKEEEKGIAITSVLSGKKVLIGREYDEWKKKNETRQIEDESEDDSGYYLE